MKFIFLGMVMVAALNAGAQEQNARTNINPALRYWEALMMAQNVRQESYEKLSATEWRGQSLPSKFGEYVSWYDTEFRLLRAAGHSTVTCDWGLDLGEGPSLLLPHLAPAKSAARIARYRVMWDLQNGKPAAARDDLLATLALARNVSYDGTLISVLVQIAMENILVSTIAENFYQIPPETLHELETGFDAVPAPRTAAQAIDIGERSFYTWFLRDVQEARKANPGDDSAVIASLRNTMKSAIGPGEETGAPDPIEKLFTAAGGTSEGLLKLLAEMPAMYDRAVTIMSLPYPEYQAQIGPFIDQIKNSPNPLINEFFPALTRAHEKEISILGELSMLKAALEYKLHGDAGFNSVMDPAGKGPFVAERFVFEGVDRGFKVKSAYNGRGFSESMIFVEKDGVPFQVDGKHVGEPVPKPDAK